MIAFDAGADLCGAADVTPPNPRTSMQRRRCLAWAAAAWALPAGS